ncbi:molybdopterin converting factor subunit 1 [Endozoicomonas sp. (ex Bugula neritina AB1)]|nr:molybdopterin converting factor subunit 1 [Endozoicomonas sp. (ex Bugula neritina AB1)]
MIKVLFFAGYREQLGCDQLVLKTDEYPETLSALREQLACKGEDWREVVSSNRTLVAVNQTMTRTEHVLEEGDEVAFFPPVTGG